MNAMSFLPRSVSRTAGLAGFVAFALLMTLPAARVAAADTELRSEIITPKGWEHRATDGACSWVADLAMSVEIIVPVGWTDSRASEAHWGGSVCSELVVPAAWNRMRAHGNAR